MACALAGSLCGCGSLGVFLGLRTRLDKIPITTLSATLSPNPLLAPGQSGRLIITASAADGPVKEETVWETLKTCYDPEIPVNIVDLGLIYDCKISPGDKASQVTVKMTLTAPGCGMGEVLVEDVKDKIQRIPTVSAARVELSFDPPWNQSMMTEAAKLQLGLL